MTSDEWRVASRAHEPPRPVSRPWPPSQCPRQSPTSFIGGSLEEDEGILFVGGEAAGEVTRHPARDGWVMGTGTCVPSFSETVKAGAGGKNRDMPVPVLSPVLPTPFTHRSVAKEFRSASLKPEHNLKLNFVVDAQHSRQRGFGDPKRREREISRGPARHR